MNAPSAADASGFGNPFAMNAQNIATLQQQLTSLLPNSIAATLLSNSGVPIQASVPQMHQQQQQQQPQPFSTVPAMQPNGHNGLDALGAIFGAQQAPSAPGGQQLAQLVADAMRLSTPVGSYPDDEDRLVNALYESELKGTTYRRALDGLHGVNNHAANMWKDYYLDHTPRINELVSRKRKPLVAKKPYFDNLGRPRSVPDSQQIAVPMKRAHSPDAEKSRQAPPSRRTSSATLYEPSVSACRGSKGKSKDEGAVRVPRRSPTPPAAAIQTKRGWKFSDEDQAYLVKYLRYRLAQDPNMSKNELCAELARKVPHHTANSWLSHWYNHRDRYDPLLPVLSRTRRPCRSSDRKTSSEDGDSEDYDEHASEDEDGLEDELETDYEVDMQEHTGPDDDFDKMAEYIVSVGDEWDGLRRREKWEPLHLQYPHRSWPAWAERYRKYKADVDKRIDDLKRKQDSVQEQRAIPSWAKDRVPQESQKHSLSPCKQEEEDSREGKRLKDEDES